MLITFDKTDTEFSVKTFFWTGKVCLPHRGFFFAPAIGFFFLKGFTAVFEKKKILKKSYFFSYFFNYKDSIFLLHFRLLIVKNKT